MTHTLYAAEQLIARDFKIRYRNMSLGMFWSLLNPLVLVVVYNFVFTKIFRNDSIAHFPLYLLIGIISFNYCSLAWMSATYAVTSNALLVKRVSVPREVLPISSVLSNSIHFGMQFVLVLAFALWAGVSVSFLWLLVPFIVALMILAVCGISLLTSSLDVYFRDTRYIVESALLVLFWLTPVFYSEKMVPPAYRTLYLLNPVTDAIIGMRQIILEHRIPDMTPMVYLLISTCALLMIGAAVFSESKKRFADHL